MSTFLSLKNIGYFEPRSERHLVKNVSLSLDAGDFLILLGGNGSGKSSLIKLINGLYKANTGSMEIAGLTHFEKLAVEDRSHLLGTITQDPQMTTFDDLSVLDNAIFYYTRTVQASKSRTPKTMKEYLVAYLDDYHPRFLKRLDQPVQKLSGGERQLLALALCFLHPPRLLLLDEHTSALDPKASDWVMKKTLEKIKEHQITVIMTTHKIEHALTFGNRLVVLKDGQMVKTAEGVEKKQLKFDDVVKFYDL